MAVPRALAFLIDSVPYPQLMLIALAVGCTAAYVLLAGCALLTLARKRPADTPDAAPPLSVSIIVAARNEAAVLERCLHALQQQAFPEGRIEYIIVDDQSTDETPLIIERFTHLDPRFRTVHVPPDLDMPPGKARALHAGFQHAKGNIVLITDADCAPPPHWAINMAARFASPDLGVLCGTTVVTHTGRLRDQVQALDWLLLLTVAAGASAAGFPLTAMGNNMAVRREAYEEVGGYAALPFSVTEDYALFRAVHERTRWKVLLSLDASLKNVTLPLGSLAEVFAQRKRWARGGLDARAWVHAGYVLVYLAHILPLAAVLSSPIVAGLALLVKCLADYVVTRFGRKRLKEQNSTSAFLLFELYLFAYVVLMPFALLLSPTIHWKERRY